MTASLLEKVLSFLADIASFAMVFYMMFWLQFYSGWVPERYDPSKDFAAHITPFLIHIVGWVALFLITGLYRKWMLHSRSYQIYCIGKTVGLGVILLFCMSFGPDILSSIFSAQPVKAIYTPFFKILIIYFFVTTFVVSQFRMAIQTLLRFLLARGVGIDKMIVIGTRESSQRLVTNIEKTPHLGHRVAGFIAFHPTTEKEVEGYPILGGVQDLRRIVEKQRITSLTITHEESSHDQILTVLAEVADLPIRVFVVPDLYDVVTGPFKTSFVHGVDLKELFPHNMPEWQVALKRILDLSVATLLLLLTLPITLTAALAIRLDSPGPIFYAQERMGQFGRIFKVYKFRTMRTDAEANGPQWATKGDSRITRVGAFLRKTRIDEIPQFICVFRGEMSMVGPRPEREHFVKKLKGDIPLYTRRLVMKPGITGWAQVRHHYDTSIEDVKRKLMYDLYYFENMSILLDFQILLRTIYVVLTGRGAQ